MTDENNLKKLSNPYSTGGGGVHFEANVQASFAVLMLTCGFAPCLPNHPIKKIKFQGKYAGYETDDLIVFVNNDRNNDERKLLGQIKHSIGITKNDKQFKEVIQAAWNDYNNVNLFARDKDILALITGPLSKTDIDHARTILEWARHSDSSREFFDKVEEANFSSKTKKNKLEVFEYQLKSANNGVSVEKEKVFDFLRHFHLLSYDLDIKAGLNLSFLHSLISKHSSENISHLWAKIVLDIEEYNHNAGTISLDSIPEDWLVSFKQQIPRTIPSNLANEPPSGDIVDWNQHDYASELAIATLIGSWNEKNEADIEIISKLAKQEYSVWIRNLRKLLQESICPIEFSSGKWKIKNRDELWQSLGSHFFDEDLQKIQEVAITVLSEKDPKFDLPFKDRIYASIYNKLPKYSLNLRQSLAETLALLGNRQEALIHCTKFVPENISKKIIRELLSNANWELWASLGDFLPIFAEAAPDLYLDLVDESIARSPSPFDDLFSQEGDQIYGGTYSLGLRLSFETLAWGKDYLVRSCILLAKLGNTDGGKNSTSNFQESISTILLPWLPQTTAPFEKRKATINALINEFPQIAWETLKSLLPRMHQMSSGTYKPRWRINIPDDWDKKVEAEDYLEQIQYYSEKLVDLAKNQVDKLIELVNNLCNLPQVSLDKALEYLSSDEIIQAPENDRQALWSELKKLSIKHKRHLGAKWALDSQTIEKIDEIAEKLAPINPLKLYKSLFCSNILSLYEEIGDFKKQEEIVKEKRRDALKKIFNYGGMDAIVEFATSVENAREVGRLLSDLDIKEADLYILPEYLDVKNENIKDFTELFIWNQQYNRGWEWVDKLNRSDWSISQIAKFLSFLPFTKETWKRVSEWLGEENEEKYWLLASPQIFDDNDDFGDSVDCLIKYGRPVAAIKLLADWLIFCKHFDKERSINTLLALVTLPQSNEKSNSMTSYEISKLIEALQNDPEASIQELYQIEWAYLSILGDDQEVSPKSLELGLANDPALFCQVLGFFYRSKNEPQRKTEPSEQKKRNAQLAYALFRKWKTPPGVQEDGSFSEKHFLDWLDEVREMTEKSGHLDSALYQIGEVLFYCPSDPSGLWINKKVAEVLNQKEMDEMRIGFRIEARNSRGPHFIDPEGKPERELAEKYRKKADEVENAGFYRFATTLRDLAKTYNQEAEENSN